MDDSCGLTNTRLFESRTVRRLGLGERGVVVPDLYVVRVARGTMWGGGVGNGAIHSLFVQNHT